MNIEQTQHMDPESIIKGLQSTESDIIRSAAFAAADAELIEAVDLLCKQVSSSNIGVQEAVEYALRKLRGKKTVQGMIPLLRSDDAPIRNIAMDILREIGGDDIASLQSLMRDNDTDIRIFISDILGHTGSRLAVTLLSDALLKDPEVNVRYQAAVSLGTLAFPEAVHALGQAMHDEEWVQFSVVEALTKIRADSTINALVQSLSSCSDLVASIIVDALGEIGNIKAVPLLFKSLEKSSVPLRHKSVKAIVQILGGRSLSLLSAKDQLRFRAYLLDALQDEDDAIQKAALSGLAVMGNDEATTAIIKFAGQLDPDRDQDMIASAVRSVAAIGYNAKFAEALQSSDERTVELAVGAIAMVNDHRCIDYVKKMFWSTSREIQRSATMQLATTAQAEDVPFFEDILKKHPDAEVLKNALYFIGIHIKCQSSAELLFSLLTNPHEDVKEAALEACIALNSPVLNRKFKELFRSDVPLQRMMAIYAMGRYDLRTNITELTEALEDESATVRQFAVEAFAANTQIFQENIKYLLPRLFDENKDVRASLVELMGQSGNTDMVPHLLTALNDEDEWVCIRAVEALGQLKNQAAAPRLVQLLEKATPMLSFKIIEVLGNIGGNIAFRALLGMMDSYDAEIQHAAAEAVSRIKAHQE
ncbi:MAG: HEAT repeat domain-containing protein [Desulfovibrionaceae bacterium]